MNLPAINQARLPINSRTVFVDSNTVRIARGISADKVKEFVESGELLWVFNLARTQQEASLRHLRFWLPEILDPSAVAGFQMEEVIAKILPARRANINGAEIGQWFLVSRPSVMRLRPQLQGILENRRMVVAREPLAAFLRRRWLGAGIPNRKATRP